MASDRDRSRDDRSGGTESKRSSASMDEEKQREIANKGGHAAHEKSDAQEFILEEALEADRKGGQPHGKGHSEDVEEDGSSSSTRGGSFEQPAKAGSQSHKNR